MSSPQFVVVTSCTSRKRASVPGGRPSASKISGATLAEGVRSWEALLAGAPHTRLASELYVGRGFSEARATTRTLNARLYVVSAGLGLIPSEAKIPGYDLTTSPGPMSLAPLLARWSRNSSDWWREIGRVRRGTSTPLSALIRENSSARFLIALPSSYVTLVAEDIATLETHHVGRLRIFTSPAGLRCLPSSVRGAALPYDDRLESTRNSGTRADFPQRAMGHFVEDLHAADLPIDAAVQRVLQALGEHSPPALPSRERKSDDDIRNLIAANWVRCGGSSSRLLRFLRDDALVSCEQSRFRDLWRSVRSTMDGHGM